MPGTVERPAVGTWFLILISIVNCTDSRLYVPFQALCNILNFKISVRLWKLGMEDDLK